MVFTIDLNPCSGYPKPLSKTKIRKGSIIGAGAVVTRLVKPQTLVYGNPAKFQGWVCKCGLKLENGSSILCACGRKYYISEDRVLVEQ